MGASKYNDIPMTVIDTRKKFVHKAIIQENPIPTPKERDVNIGPLLGELFNQMVLVLQKTALTVKQRMADLTEQFPKLKTFPWLKIGILVLTAFVLLKKDMKFNIALKAPLAGISDDFDQQNSSTAVAQTVAYRPGASTNGNAYAPVGAADLHDKRTRDFIREYAPLAIEDMHKSGVPASIKIAQALVESRAGTSKLAVNNNNFFGIKCFSKNCRKGHCTNATDDHHKDFFRKYTSPKGSWTHHSQILTAGRYKKLKSYGKNYKKWATGLKKAGYATDKNYDKKLISVIKKYQLDKLDRR